MAKKVASPDEQIPESEGGVKAKKKRSKCCTCCIVMLIVTLVILVAAFTTGWILGDKYTKQYLGLSMGDTFGVVNDLYWTDDKDVVKRPFKSSDLEGFYTEIKRNILLKDDAPVDFNGALDSAIDKFLENGMPSEQRAARLNASADGASDPSENEITDILVDMIADVLNRDNIDLERLNSYPDSDPYIFHLNDKQLAAFLNVIVKKVLANADKIDGLRDISEMVNVSKILSLKQIRFTARAEEGEGGEKVVKASSADVTVWLGLQSAANQALHKLMAQAGQSWAGGIVGWLGDVILPKNLYLTISIPLFGEDNKADIIINDMNASERNRANKLINGVLKLINGDEAETLDSMLEGVVDEIKPLLESATEKMDFSAVGEGTISMDLLDTVAKMASENMEGEALTKSDFLYVLQALLSDKTEQLNSLEPYRYDNWYNVDGKLVYMPAGGAAENRIDYKDEFKNEIAQKYAVDFGEDTDLSDVLGMLGISTGDGGDMGSTDLLDMIDSERFAALLNTPDDADISLNITDRMLGAALSEQMDEILGGMADLENLELRLDALTFVKSADPLKADHLYALLAVEVKLDGMLNELGGGDELITQIATGLMPESILLTVTVDITRNRSVTRDPAEFILNSCEHTADAIVTLTKLVPELDLGEVSGQIDGTLNDMLDQMDGVVRITLRPSEYAYDDALGGWTGASGALVLPDIFSIVTDMVLTEDKDGDGVKESVVSAQELKNVIHDLNNPAEIESNIDTEHGMKPFIDDVLDKYYFKAPAQEITDFDGDNGLVTYLKDFDTSKFRVDGESGLAHDTRSIDSLKPIMTDGELGYLLMDKMATGGSAAGQSYNILGVHIAQDSLEVNMSVSLGELLGDAQQINSLITAKALYVTAAFDLKKENVLTDAAGVPYAYPVSIEINVVDRGGNNTVMDKQSTYPAMLAIVQFFAPSFDISEQVGEFGKILYEQMNSLNTSLGGSETNHMFEFTDRGMEITDFYTFLASYMHPELLAAGHTGADIKSTLQGLYAYDDTLPNANNFVANDIMFNRPTAKGSTAWEGDEVTRFYGKTHVDADFNGFVKQGVERIAEPGAITVQQTVVLARGDIDETANAVREWINGRLGLSAGDPDYLTAANDYLMLTISMSMNEFLGGDGGGTNNAGSMFPTEIYATVVYKYDATAAVGNRFAIVGNNGGDDTAPTLIFNNMSASEYEIMVSLMGLTPDSSDPDKVNINSIAEQSTTVLNGLSSVDIEVLGSTHHAETPISFAVSGVDYGVGQIIIGVPTVDGVEIEI